MVIELLLSKKWSSLNSVSQAIFYYAFIGLNSITKPADTDIFTEPVILQ